MRGRARRRSGTRCPTTSRSCGRPASARPSTRAFASAAARHARSTSSSPAWRPRRSSRARAVGEYDRRTGRYTLHTGIQGPHGTAHAPRRRAAACRRATCASSPARSAAASACAAACIPEMVLVLWAAKRLGRPVKWTSDRREGFVTDEHGRDNVSTAELALDARRHVPRAARGHHAQHRRLPHAAQRGAGHQQRRRRRRRVHDAGHPRADDRRLHEHDADRARIAAPAAPRRRTRSSA